jgi:hypothetical protein
VLKPAFAYDEVFEQNFRREAHRAAKFRHPNVIAIHYAGKENDIVFFSMDLLETGLKDLLRAGKPIEPEVIMKVGCDVASALQFAHTHEGGIVHRDLKPDNILFDRHGNAVVTDFGIAEAASNYTAATGTTVYVGTPKYMSPEQARGQRVDHRSDIYSLGVTLYEMATGQAPFSGRDWFELGRKHIEELPDLPSQKNPKLDLELERIILKCLQKEPVDRYQSAEHLRRELAALGGETVRTVVLTVQPAQTEQPAEPVTPATPPPSVQAAQQEEARQVQRAPAELYEATTRPPVKRRPVLAALLLLLVASGISAYAVNLAGLRTLGEEKFPFLAGLPLVGSGGVYVTSFFYPPVEGGVDVDEARFDIGFNAPIDPTTASSENVKLIGPDDREVPAEITVRDDGKKIVVAAARRLRYDTDYRIEIGPGLLSAQGTPIRQNPRAEQPGAEFPVKTRRPPPDTDPPSLSGSTPAKDERDVPADRPLRLTFSERMDPTTLNSESVRLRDSQGNLIAIQVLVHEDLQTAQVQPITALARGARYTLLLSAAITDPAGNALRPDSIMFSTAGGARSVAAVPLAPAKLNVTVSPAAAIPLVKIYLDGQEIGNPPRLDLEIEPQVSHTVRLVAAPEFSAHGLVLHQETFIPAAGARRDITKEVRPFGWVTVTSEPAAEAFIDGEYKGATPLAGLTLESGTHKLELHPTADNAAQYGLYSSQFEVPAFQGLNLGRVRLPPKQ